MLLDSYYIHCLVQIVNVISKDNPLIPNHTALHSRLLLRQLYMAPFASIYLTIKVGRIKVNR